MVKVSELGPRHGPGHEFANSNLLIQMRFEDETTVECLGLNVYFCEAVLTCTVTIK